MKQPQPTTHAIAASPVGRSSQADSRGAGSLIQAIRQAPGFAAQEASLAPVQQRADGQTAAAGEVHAAAARGVAGGGGRLPHAERIQAAFGRHDVSQVQAHVGANADAATSAMGASAYATGNDVVLGSGAQDLHTVAHEAAHVVQQRAGVQLSGGVGQAGDAYEQNADAVADAVVAGRSAEGLLDGAGPSSAAASGGVQRSAVQFYSEVDIGGKAWRVSDNADMAIRQDSPVYGGRFFYAKSGLITGANATLQGQKSMLQVEPGGDTLQVAGADGQEATLTRVEPSNTQDKTSGNDRAGGMMWQEDCGGAANNVMQGPQYDGKAVFNQERKRGWLERIIGFLTTGNGAETVVEEQETETRHYGTAYYSHRNRKQYSPQKMLNDIFEAVSGKSFDKAWEDYQKLSDKERDEFDALVGINKYAQAEVGEAYSIVANRDENIDQRVWNFHWGAVIMRSSGDSVTLENFAGSGKDAWDFQMYGPPSKQGQTFHEQQKERTKHDGVTPEYGDNPTTIRVRPK